MLPGVSVLDVPRRNWAGNHAYPFERVARPASLEELQEVVLAEPALRALGSRHSFTAMADAPVALVLDGLEPRFEVAADRRTVTASGWLTYAELAARLDAEGLALHNMASLPHISVAGAIASATHGSGAHHRNLAGAVRGLQLVTGTGELLELGPEHPDLAGATVHLGALGAVTAVTLAVEPAYEVVQRVYEDLSWDALVHGFDEVMALGTSVSVFTDWGAASRVWLKARTDADAPPATVLDARAAEREHHPIDGLDTAACTPQLGVPGPWWDRLPHFRADHVPSNGEEVQSELHVPRAAAGAAIVALREAAPGFRDVLQVGELRAVARDELWLSPQFERDTASFHFTWALDPEGVRAALAHVERALAPFDPRPHWGKVSLAMDGPVGHRYERLDDFLALRERLDPERRFANPWLERVLG